MTFAPKTEQEILDARLWNKGEYEFTIKDASEETSRAGHSMIELTLRITDAKNGKSRVVTDYLLAERPQKLRHCCAALGMLAKYETGALSSDDFVGGSGKLTLGIEKDRKHLYPDKNVVLDYVWPKPSGNEERKEKSSGSILKFA